MTDAAKPSFENICLHLASRDPDVVEAARWTVRGVQTVPDAVLERILDYPQLISNIAAYYGLPYDMAGLAIEMAEERERMDE